MRYTAPCSDRLRDALVAVVGERHVSVDPELTAAARVDWTRRWSGPAVAVVRAADVVEVAAVVRTCAEARVAVVVQGGNTGLVGASVPGADGAVVLVTDRLVDIGPVDRLTRCVTVGAGVTIADLQRVATGAGLRYSIDFGARDRATVGGSIATNAGGNRAFRHGMTRHAVVGLEVVSGDGAVLRSRLIGAVDSDGPGGGAPGKDNVGPDVLGLLVGSEGTLGVVTAARVRLIDALPDPVVVTVGIDSFGTIDRLARWAGDHVGSLDALEFVDGGSLSRVVDELGLRAPDGGLGAGVFVILEASGADLGALAEIESLSGVIGTEVAQSASRRALAWRRRDGVTEVLARRGGVVKLDVAVAPDRIDELCTRIHHLVDIGDRRGELWLFGHVGDGNVHVNLVDVREGRVASAATPGDGDAPGPLDVVGEQVLELVAAMGGSISAEHGIGRAKLAWVPAMRSPAERAVWRAAKDILDPNGIMNPGVLLG